MPADLVIKNGTYVLPGSTMVKDLGIIVDKGKIQSICPPEYLPEGQRTIDATGKYVLPGLIDPHVHNRAPGYEYKEDAETCSAAAAAGGITTTLLMFNVKPIVRDQETFQYFVDYTSQHSIVNFNVHSILVEGNFDQIPILAKAGVASFKVLLGYKFDVSGAGGQGRPDTIGTNAPEDGGLLESMRILAENNLVLLAHCENDNVISRIQAGLKAKGQTGPLVHTIARPRVASDEAISRLIAFSKDTGCHLHVIHLETGNGLQMIHKAQFEGQNVTSETCAHYLLMTHEEHMAKVGSVAKINPPIRSQFDQDELWKGIANGSVTVIGSDHSPHTPQEKMTDRPFDDVFQAMAGFVGVETTAPLLLTEVNKGRLTLLRLVELMSTNIAKLFGLYPELGALQSGSRADVTIVDLAREGVIEASKLHSKTTVTPFDGWKVKGMPVQTIVNGKVVYDEGTVVGKPGDGKFVRAYH